MKTLIVAILVCFGLSYANAQKLKNTDVPVEISKAFSEKFPNAEIKSWKKEDSDFEVEFKLNKVESSATYDEKGNFKEEEQEIEMSKLPKTAIDYCNKNFAGYKISEAAKIIDSKNTIMYEAEMEKGKDKFDALFDDKGNFVKKNSDNED